MYLITVKDCEEERILLAKNHRELNDVVNLSPKVDYEILKVEKINYDTAEDYLKEIRNIIYPRDDNLLFGIKFPKRSEIEGSESL